LYNFLADDMACVRAVSAAHGDTPLSMYRGALCASGEKLMVAIWLAALILGSVYAIAGAQGIQWKLTNLIIILGCIGLGIAIGYAAGLGSVNMGRVPNGAGPFAMILGTVGAMACVALNRSRANA
jgi:hypothetical protein